MFYRYITFYWWITKLIFKSLKKKNNLLDESAVWLMYKKKLRRFYSLEKFIEINFDLKQRKWIFRLFFEALFFDTFAVAIFILINIVYVLIPNFYLFDDTLSKTKMNWHNWLFFNLLYFIFLIRLNSDYYKVSLKGKYRIEYLKWWWIDLFTLNVFGLLGIWIFNHNKKTMINNFKDNKIINNSNLTSQAVKEYVRSILKVELFVFISSLLMIIGSFIAFYFIPLKEVKLLCLAFVGWNFMKIYLLSFPRLVSMMITKKMLENLFINNNDNYLAIILNFLSHAFGTYFSAIFVNYFKFNDDYILNILN